MNCDNIITGIFTILGAIVGGYITWLVAIRASRRQTFNEAAAMFHSAFTEELILLHERYDKNASNNEVFEIVENSINKHETAMIKFRPYLIRDVSGFDEAWKNYAYPNQDEFPINPIIDYLPDKNKSVADIRKQVRERLEKLLSYALPE